MIEIFGLILGVLGLLFAFQKPRKILLELLPTNRFHEELGIPQISIDILSFKRALRSYELKFRVVNRSTSGTSAISKCIFLEISNFRTHDLTISKLYYGAAINQVPGENNIYNIRPKLGLWELFKEPRTYPANEIEDFRVELKFQEGFAYLLRVGIDWFPLNSPNTNHRNFSDGFYAIANPRDYPYPPDRNTYVPADSFVNKPVHLQNEHQFESIIFEDPRSEA